MALVTIGLVVLFGAVAAALVSVLARRQHPYAPGSHAGADVTAHDPLGRALRRGYASVEIAVRLDDTDRLLVGVAGGPTDPSAELGRLVLAPLVERIRGNGGRVYADTADTLRLVIDVRDPDPVRQERAYEQLEVLLASYPDCFTRECVGAVRPGPVTVLLTGNDVPRFVIAAQAEHAVFVEGTFADLGPWGAPPALVPLLSEHWSARFDWDGRGELPRPERNCLHHLVAAAHAEGRRVRFSGIPRRPWRVREAFWCELAAAGVDLFTTARPRSIARFFRGYAAPPPVLLTTLHPWPVRRAAAVPAHASVHRVARRVPESATRHVPTAARRGPRHRVARSAGTTRAATR